MMLIVGWNWGTDAGMICLVDNMGGGRLILYRAGFDVVFLLDS